MKIIRPPRPSSHELQMIEMGASDGIRTHDLLFTKQLLYP